LMVNRVFAHECSEEVKDCVFSLVEANMKELYEASNWGWNESQKRKELQGKTSQYLLVKDQNSKIKGLVHYRFDLDFGAAVMYCYEIQLEEDVQRKGIGGYLMTILQKLAERFKMKKVVLTVLKHNTQALGFYQKKLQFRMDSTNPKENDVDYVILSKKAEKV